MVGAGLVDIVPPIAPGEAGAIVVLEEAEGGIFPDDIPGADCTGTCAELSPAGAAAVFCAIAKPAEHKTAIAVIGINRITSSIRSN